MLKILYYDRTTKKLCYLLLSTLAWALYASNPLPLRGIKANPRICGQRICGQKRLGFVLRRDWNFAVSGKAAAIFQKLYRSEDPAKRSSQTEGKVSSPSACSRLSFP